MDYSSALIFVWVQDVDIDYSDSIHCFFTFILRFPVQFINYCAVGLTDCILLILPSTPEGYQLDVLLAQLATEHYLIWRVSGEIFLFAIPMISTLLIVKAWKLYRPF